MQPEPILFRECHEASDALHQKLLAVWERKRADCRLPMLHDIGAEEFSGNRELSLVAEVARQGNFLISEMGDEVLKLTGENWKGQFAGPGEGSPVRRRICEILQRVKDLNEPVYTSVMGSRMPGGQNKQFNTLWLPFGSDGEHTDLVMATVVTHELIDLLDRT